MKTVRITIALSELDNHQLIIWGRLHGKSKGAYASQILSSRISANRDEIIDDLTKLAEIKGKTIEEVEAELLQEDEREGKRKSKSNAN